jgi:azurin
MRTSLVVAVVIFALACTSCQEDKKGSGGPVASALPSDSAASPSPTVPPQTPPTASAKPAEHVEMQIGSVANTMAYDKTKLSVPTGAEVHLVLKNNATMTTLPHNWVLVKQGTEASVAAAGLKLGEPAGYIDVRDKDVLFHTPLAKPGETTEVTFTAPAAGDYPYICTVPGHYMMMKGTLTVTP